MSASNAVILTQIALQLATQLQQVISIQMRARNESREISDEEVASAANGAEDAIERLKTMR